MITIKFKIWNCVVKFGHYSNKRIAIQLIDAEDGSPIAKATLNDPGQRLKEGEIIIKDYSENEGMAKALYKAGIISEPIKYIWVGHVKTPICKLLKTE